MHTSELLLKEIQRKKELLPLNDRDIVNKVFLFISSDLTISQNYSKEIMNDLLDHLLDAARNGVSAHNFFGGDPEQFAKDFLDEVPKENKRYFMYLIGTIVCIALITVFAVHLIASIPYLFTDGKLTINLFSALLALAVYLTVIIYGSYFALKNEQKYVFHPERRSRLRMVLTYLLFGILMVPVPFGLYKYCQLGPNISLPIYISIASILFSGLLANYFSKKMD